MRAKEPPEHIKADWPWGAWIVEMLASGSRGGKPFKARLLFITSLRNTPEALLRLIREPWSIKTGTGFATRSSMRTSTPTEEMAPVLWQRWEHQRRICCTWLASTQTSSLRAVIDTRHQSAPGDRNAAAADEAELTLWISRGKQLSYLVGSW